MVRLLMNTPAEDTPTASTRGMCAAADLSAATIIAVLNFGRIIAKGTPDEIRNNPQVIEAYLGKKEG